MKRYHSFTSGLAGCVVLAVCAIASTAKAEVRAIRATIESTVQEIVSQEAGSSDNSFETFPDTSPTLPMVTFAALGSFVEGNGVNYGAQGIAEFSDPTLSTDPNPGELGVEANTVSLDSSLGYEVESTATEERAVVFSSAELGLSVAPEQLVTSTVFVNGAILVWTADPERDLTGLEAGFDIEVVQNSPTVQNSGTNGQEVVFTASLSMSGTQAGDVEVSQSSVLVSVLGGAELLGTIDAGDVENLITALGENGRLHLLFLPEQSVDYAYLVAPDQDYELVANVRCRAKNLPDGTVVSAVFGRPFESLAATLEPVFNAKLARQTQAAVNRAMTTIAADNPAGADLPSAPMCGAVGLEVLGVGLAFFLSTAWAPGFYQRRRNAVERRQRGSARYD